MAENLVAKSTITVNAPKRDVWRSLTDPSAIEKYMFGAKVQSDWSVGSPITWSGELKGKPYQDKGEILEFEPEDILAYTHYSPASGEPDQPESYHTIKIKLADSAGNTNVTLTQDNNPNEEAKQHSQENWGSMLKGLKQVTEGNA